MHALKKCARCQRLKPRTEFYRNLGWRDGLHPYCKPCLLAYQRVSYQRKPRLTARRWATTLGVNETFFTEIDDDVKAYLLGLFEEAALLKRSVRNPPTPDPAR